MGRRTPAPSRRVTVAKGTDGGQAIGVITRDSPGSTSQRRMLVSNLLAVVVGGGLPALLAGDGVGCFRRGCPMPHRYF